MPADIRDLKVSSGSSPTRNALIEDHRSYRHEAPIVGYLIGRRHRGVVLRQDDIPPFIAKPSERTELGQVTVHYNSLYFKLPDPSIYSPLYLSDTVFTDQSRQRSPIQRLAKLQHRSLIFVPTTTMDTLSSSIQTIVLFSGSILGAAAILWALWKIYGFIGFPIGKMFLRVGNRGHLDTQEKKDFQCALSGAVVGGFLCYGLIAWSFIPPVGMPTYSVPGQEVYDMTLWIVKTLLQACGESIVVLAILSGVVKIIGLDGKKEATEGLGKEESRLA